MSNAALALVRPRSRERDDSVRIGLAYGHRILLYAVPERTPPKEFLLFPYGEISTRKGKFFLTEESAREVFDAYLEHDVDVVLDYNHKSLDPKANDHDARASGSAKLELRGDGVWLTQIKWTDDADSYLRAGEYRYLSPAFDADKSTHEILELINVAVTNLPATDGIKPLVAASMKGKRMAAIGRKLKAHMKASGMSHAEMSRKLKMDPRRLKRLMDGAEADEEEMARCSKMMGQKHNRLAVEPMGEDGQGFLQAARDDSDDEADEDQNDDDDEDYKMDIPSETLTESGEVNIPVTGDEANENREGTVPTSRKVASDTIMAALGVSSPTEALSKIRELQEAGEQAEENADAITQLRREIADGQRREVMASLKRDGKLNPELEKFAATLSLEQLRNFAKTAPKVSGGSGLQEVTPRPTELAGVTLSGADMDVIRLTVSDPKEYAGFKKAMGEEQLSAGHFGYPMAEETRQPTAADVLLHNSFIGRTGRKAEKWRPSKASPELGNEGK